MNKEKVNNIKISVLMPIYNTLEQHLREAIESILSQRFANFEFIILNDSPENVQLDKIVAQYQDPRIIYIKNEKNIGITPSRNKLIELAKGEYLAVMDHDDISLPERFFKQVAVLNENPDIGVVSCWASTTSGKNIFFPENDKLIKIVLMKHCALLHPASMIRKSILLGNNCKYEEFFSPAEDYKLWVDLIPHTQFYNIPEILFIYRDHINNTSHLQSNMMSQVAWNIQNIAITRYPFLYENFLKLYGIEQKIYKLFFFILILKSIKSIKYTKYYLFGFIPILKIKTREHDCVH